MTGTIKPPAEQDKMREAGRLAASVLDMIEPFVQPGVSTEELDKRCHDFIVEELKSIPANLNYRGFPKTICTSVNHVVCHGIPGDKKLKPGDIVNIDVTVIKDGFHGDSSRMFYVGAAAIQAMINAGRPGIRCLADGWTIVTADHSLSAQWEHTVLVTDDGYEVLTVS